MLGRYDLGKTYYTTDKTCHTPDSLQHFISIVGLLICLIAVPICFTVITIASILVSLPRIAKALLDWRKLQKVSDLCTTHFRLLFQGLAWNRESSDDYGGIIQGRSFLFEILFYSLLVYHKAQHFKVLGGMTDILRKPYNNIYCEVIRAIFERHFFLVDVRN